MTSLPITEGFILFHGYQTFYKIVGDLAQIPTGSFPVLTLHGRPPSHEVLEPLAVLAESGRPVIFYDQLGCGRSDRPDDPSLWNIGLFVDELEVVRRDLNLDQIHLLGHSWGGVVAMEYALRQLSRIISLTLASTFASRAIFDEDYERLYQELPPDILGILKSHEEAGTTDDPAYREAEKAFSHRHVCRLDPWPEYFDRALQHPPVGRVNTEGLEILDRLPEINSPTLITCGRFDFCTPRQAELIHKGIPNSELIIFENSSHYAHAEETELYIEHLITFLTRVEEKVDS
jgi:proline-specific peptidase